MLLGVHPETFHDMFYYIRLRQKIYCIYYNNSTIFFTKGCDSVGNGATFISGNKKEEYEQMIRCFPSHEKHYSSGELVCTYGENSSLIGVVLEGTLQLLRTHADGRQTILEQLEKGEIFGESLSFSSYSISPLQIYCAEKSTVLYLIIAI